MRLSGVLETFDSKLESDEESSGFSSEVIEDQKLASFEAGYRAGWEDSVAASNTSDHKMYEKFGKEILRLQETQSAELDRVTTQVREFNLVALEKFFASAKEIIFVKKICQKIDSEIRDRQDFKINLAVSRKKDVEFLKNLQSEIDQEIKTKIDSNLNDGDLRLEIGSSKWEFNLESVIDEMTGVLLDLNSETDRDLYNDRIGDGRDGI